MNSLTNMVQELIKQSAGNTLEKSGSAIGEALTQVFKGNRDVRVLHGEGAHIDAGALGDVIDSVFGKLSGHHLTEHPFSKPETQAAFLLSLIPFLLDWVQQQGGVAQALQRLKEQGLQHQVQSWVGQGVNDRIMPEVLMKLFAKDEIAALARRFGVNTSTVYTGLATALPQLVNSLTPDGHAQDLRESDHEATQVLSLLSNFRH